MRSPPTSRARAAISSVDVTTFSAPFAARATFKAATPAAATVMNCRLVMSTLFPLEGVRPMGADAELKLEQQLVGIAKARIAAVPILRANLAELARPIGH